MNMFRQDLWTDLFILSPLEVLRPFPVPFFPTTLRTTKAEPLFGGSFLSCPRGSPVAWWEWSCWGGSPINGAPLPQSYFFCLLVWDRVSCHRHNMQWLSVIAQYIWVDAGATSHQQFHGRVLVEVQGVRPLEAPKNLHLTVPNSGFYIAQQ